MHADRDPKRYRNFDDLLRKLAWYACLFRPIDTHWKGSNDPALDRRLSLKNRVTELMTARGLPLDEYDDPTTVPDIPALPIAELLMAVCFESRPWTSTG